MEFENKFILDTYSMVLFGNEKPPSRFNNTSKITATARRYSGRDTIAIRGRILPQKEPYCHASFLIEITLPREYPFKPPDVTFLDPIYHPNVTDEGSLCCCCDHIVGHEEWRPTTRLSDFIEAAIRRIDTIPSRSESVNIQCAEEYQNHYLKFYEKALRLVLSYGRPRY
jgi:ubiquitin-protein ligase